MYTNRVYRTKLIIFSITNQEKSGKPSESGTSHHLWQMSDLRVNVTA